MLLLITGASGVGKSTVREALAPELAPQVQSAELGQLAPLPPPAGMTPVWRQQMAETAVRRAVELQDSGRHLLLAGDPVPAAEVVAAPSAPQLDGIAACLLDASPEAQADRLGARGDDLSLLVHHQRFAAWMREQARDPLYMPHVVSGGGWDQMCWERLARLRAGWGVHVIDTSELSRGQVASAALEWCRQALAGDAPVLVVPAP